MHKKIIKKYSIAFCIITDSQKTEKFPYENMNGILGISTGYSNDSVVITGCPCRDLQVRIVSRNYSKYCIYVTTWGDHESTTVTHSVDVYVGSAVEEICRRYLANIAKLKDLIGFVPYYDIVDNRKVYVPEEVFLARQKPIEMCTYHGVEIPKAFMNKIEVTQGITDSLGESASGEPMTGEWHDKLIPAFQKLNTLHGLTISDVNVYDYIGLLDVFKDSPIFINGDIIYKDNDANRLATGRVNPDTLWFNMPKFTVDEPVSPNVIEMGSCYQVLIEAIKLAKTPEAGYEFVLATELIAQRVCGYRRPNTS